MGVASFSQFGVWDADGRFHPTVGEWFWMDWNTGKDVYPGFTVVPVKCRVGRHPGRVLSAAEVTRRAAEARDGGFDSVHV